MEGNTNEMRIEGLTPEELAKDFMSAVVAGNINVGFAVKVLIERVYVSAVQQTAADWFDLEAKAKLKAQFDEEKKRRDFEFKGLNRAGAVN
jgi:hypothetical protein